MIVDDEYLVKVGIKNCIDWHYHGFNEPLEASSAIDALEILKRVKIDLIMTDIRMPYKDGFKLIEAIRQMGCDTELIILSCHNTQEYRHLSEEYGVCAYLFKPKMMPEDIQNAILKAKERIDQKKWKQQAMLAPPTFLEETAKAAKSEFLYSLLEGKKLTEPDYMRYWTRYGLNLDYTNVVVMILQIDEAGEGIDYNDGEMIDRKIRRILVQEYHTVCRGETVCRSPSRHVLICSFLGGRVKGMENCRCLAGNLATEISDSLGKKVWIGVGGLTNSLSDVKRSYGQAADALEQRFFAYERTLLFCDEVLRGRNDVQPWLLKLPSVKTEKGQLLSELRSRAADFMLSREEFCEAASILANEIIKKQYQDNIPNVKAQELQLAVFKKIRHASCAEEILNFLEELQHSFQWDQEVRVEVNLALQYIKENLGDSGLSLSSTAEKVGISANYLGKLFHQSIGKGFTEYLTEQRVARARELLDVTNLKVYEIAEQVGYNDWRYFSKIFKKHTGRTLRQSKGGK